MTFPIRTRRLVAIAGLLPPVALWLAVWLVPDTITRSGEAGTFIDASVAPGGLGSHTVTSVHTTGGTFIVTGVYPGVPSGEPMAVQESTRSGLELCVRAKPDSCMQLASGYTGPMRTVAPTPFRLSYAARMACTFVGIFWFLAGVLALMAHALACDDGREAGNRQQNER